MIWQCINLITSSYHGHHYHHQSYHHQAASMLVSNPASCTLHWSPSQWYLIIVGSSYRMAYDAKDPKAVLPGVVGNYASNNTYHATFDIDHASASFACRAIANPTLTFSPIKIRGLTLKNRVVVAPMCQYSAEDGFMNDHHFRHLTTFGTLIHVCMHHPDH